MTIATRRAAEWSVCARDVPEVKSWVRDKCHYLFFKTRYQLSDWISLLLFVLKLVIDVLWLFVFNLSINWVIKYSESQFNSWKKQRSKQFSYTLPFLVLFMMIHFIWSCHVHLSNANNQKYELFPSLFYLNI